MNKLMSSLTLFFALLFMNTVLTAQDAVLVSEIEKLYAEDQKYAIKDTPKGEKYGSNTREVLAQMKELKVAKVANLAKARTFIKENGFPTVSKVGKDACHKFCLVVLGLDEDVDFQMTYLRLMETAVEANDGIKEDFAFMSDRVRINMGMKQWYGTQMKKNADGKYIPYEIENPDYVNIRRAEVNLPEMMVQETAAAEKIGGGFKRNEENVRY